MWCCDVSELNQEVVTTDTMVTMVDAHNILRDFKSVEKLAERGESVGPEDERTIVDLLTEQIGTAVASCTNVVCVSCLRVVNARSLTHALDVPVEFADVIIVNKLDLVTEEEASIVQALLQRLNPSANVIKTKFGKVKRSQFRTILNSRSFSFEKAALAPGWLQTIRGEVRDASSASSQQSALD
jgi:G3E family GTPase